MIPKDFLRERDVKLLDFLYQFKVASIDDIQDVAFNKIGKNHVYARLKELVNLDIIQKILYKKEGRNFAAYSLSRKSFHKLLANGECGDARKQFLSNKVNHDLSIVTIYKRFIQSPRIVDFITENVLMSSSSELRSYGIEDWVKNNSDGILIDDTSKGRYFLPLECELSVKKWFRYETKLTRYYQSEKVPAVIYVCKNAQIRDAIIGIDEKYCYAYRPKVFYGLLEQFQNDSEQLTFENRKKGQLKF